MGDMADYYDDRESYDFENDSYIITLMTNYNTAKSAKVKSKIRCPVCNKSIIKTTYHKIFCSNGKTKKRGNCKDRYWNSVDDVRRDRAILYSKK